MENLHNQRKLKISMPKIDQQQLADGNNGAQCAVGKLSMYG